MPFLFSLSTWFSYYPIKNHPPKEKNKKIEQNVQLDWTKPLGLQINLLLPDQEKSNSQLFYVE